MINNSDKNNRTFALLEASRKYVTKKRHDNPNHNPNPYPNYARNPNSTYHPLNTNPYRTQGTRGHRGYVMLNER